MLVTNGSSQTFLISDSEIWLEPYFYQFMNIIKVGNLSTKSHTHMQRTIILGKIRTIALCKKCRKS